MNQPLVSIIMPAYNAERFIKESIESVINQSYKNWELLVINDSSKDSTQSTVQNFIKGDRRIKLLNQEVNKGVVEARNRGIRESKGRYIAFLDSDDLWQPNKLKIQINYMLNKKVYMTYTGYSYIDEDGKYIRNIPIPKSLNYKQALKGNQIGCLTVVIDKHEVGEFQMPNLKHEDYATWLNILKSGVLAEGIQENLAKYRKVSDSLSSNKLKTINWTWKIFRINERINIIKSLFYLFCHTKQAIKKHRFE